MMNDVTTEPTGWRRALIAGEKVQERLLRATAALDQTGVLYAVIGGNAVAEWVGRVDPGAVRFTKDVDLLVRRLDFSATRAALEGAGFVYHHVIDIDVFIDGPDCRPSDGVHIIFACEPVRPDYQIPSPDVTESERAQEFQVASLTAVVQMKLIGWRDKDRTHLRDLVGVGLIDATWPARFPAELGKRLQELLDNPNG